MFRKVKKSPRMMLAIEFTLYAVIALSIAYLLTA
jgi:hypothetical protein